ncbi:MAG: hypothetical protein UR99_C0046G0009 [Candidatus Moranbacteria bacterium GW2011_GWD2_36_12]|nr:MAG: hypothetical protein UR99_C0046G0009 [Candidatus Moranbacteria bacterium GW2011_GWD2_36_12]KKQ04889.1 MAG: hypothetical protein US16_C0043G0009 [Candidatus Moranbacteria bacterium GW2011_GWE2_36_40]
MAMTIEKLIAASKGTIVTEDSVRRRKERLAAAEQRFVAEAKSKEVDESFLNKEYII